ncbi:type VI secretion system-associated FHA domain protein TagH [Paraburkholderia sp. MPAMCS5]|uniref:type VI secretion system-associated FHA domain protein TagH n=1 Tax=Paraburkholderia sp. MPAMCS5 TaxID=3112563 RepID=UPI002E176860|nr:type VI secretion system-associated FHA domain protein TagH [Paraburkholderia sp. MPAMCS5]
MSYPILSLRVVQFNDEAVAEPIVVEFGPAGGTIGRASDCNLVLPDPQRAISRVHARVEFRGGDYLLCDLGSNPSVLNQRALGGTREARLADGDRLLVGAYLLEVSIGEAAAGLRSLTGGHDPLSAAQVLGGPLPADSEADALRIGALDPLGQPGFGAQQGTSTQPRFTGSESDHVSPELRAFPVSQPAQERGPIAPLAQGIPADYDPLADALAQWETPAQPGSGQFSATPHHAAHEMASPAPAPQGGPTGLPAGLLDTCATSPVATPFDDLFPATSAPPSASLSAPAVPSAPVVPVVVPVVAPQAASARLVTPAAASAQSDPTPPAPIAPPQTFATTAADSHEHAVPPATPGTQARPYARAPESGNSATFHALLAGLGLDASRAPNLPEAEFARLVGEMLRESLRGTMAVLRARSITKREARLDTTMIVARDNNPLKFFPDVDSALAQMLTGRSAGYLPPGEALARAFNDIEAHELAVIAGMRAALAHVLGRFDPALIEGRLKEPGALEKVLSNRKAKLWDLFVEVQGAVTREADDDIQKLFGKAFNDAYEAQIEALHAARERQAADPADPH